MADERALMFRRSGRTTRIINYILEQLYLNDMCVATDHIAHEKPYDYSDAEMKTFIKKVDKASKELQSIRNKKLVWKPTTINNVKFLIFKLQ